MVERYSFYLHSIIFSGTSVICLSITHIPFPGEERCYGVTDCPCAQTPGHVSDGGAGGVGAAGVGRRAGQTNARVEPLGTSKVRWRFQEAFFPSNSQLFDSLNCVGKRFYISLFSFFWSVVYQPSLAYFFLRFPDGKTTLSIGCFSSV